MKQIKPWVEENHDGDIKSLSELSNIPYRTLSRYVKDNEYLVDDYGVVYKKITKLKPKPFEKIKTAIQNSFLQKKNKIRSELLKFKLVR